MGASFQITETDYTRAVGLAGRPSLRGLLLILAIVVFTLGLAFRGPLELRLFAVSVWTVAAIVRFVVVPVRARWHYRNYRAVHEPVHMELQEDGIAFTKTSGAGKIPWTNIFKWRQNRDYVLVYLAPRLFCVIPKSVAADGFDVDALVEKLNRNVGAPR